MWTQLLPTYCLRMTVDAIGDKARPTAQRIAALNALHGASLPPKAVFQVLHDESDDVEVRLAAVRAVGRSRGAINQLVRYFRPAPVRLADVAELERIAKSPPSQYYEEASD